jgi:hypothetical protein
VARRSPPRKVTYFEPVPPRLARNTIIESTFEVGRPVPLHDAHRLRPARSRSGDPARPRRMAPADARAPRRGGAGGLARRPQRGLSARGPDRRRASRSRTHEPSIRALLYEVACRRQEAPLCEKKTPAGGGRGFRGDELISHLPSPPVAFRSPLTGALVRTGIATPPRPGLNPHRPRPSIRGFVQPGFCAIPRSCSARRLCPAAGSRRTLNHSGASAT